MWIGAIEGHEFDLQAMFDRGDHPARGRRGGGDGAPTTIVQDDNTLMRVKGKQFVPHGRKVMMAFLAVAVMATRKIVIMLWSNVICGDISRLKPPVMFMACPKKTLPMLKTPSAKVGISDARKFQYNEER